MSMSVLPTSSLESSSVSRESPVVRSIFEHFYPKLKHEFKLKPWTTCEKVAFVASFAIGTLSAIFAVYFYGSRRSDLSAFCLMITGATYIAGVCILLDKSRNEKAQIKIDRVMQFVNGSNQLNAV